VTGHNGYIGSVLVPMLLSSGRHDVTGLDTYYYEACTYGDDVADPPSIRKDVRDVQPADLDGFDAVVHLAALSNDPLGDLQAATTYEINHHAGVRLARLAKQMRVTRFVFASSCSLYGASGDDILDEDAAFNPVTPYGESKVLSERDLTSLMDDSFSPTFLRNATAYGGSPRLRGDVVVNNLVGHAFATSKVLLNTDGNQWRPLVHVADISRAVIAVLEAPRHLVHGEAFNVGDTTENYRIRDVARIVRDTVPNSEVTLSDDAGVDLRNYRVNCDKIAERLGFHTKWTVQQGAQELLETFTRHGLSLDQLHGPQLTRLARIAQLSSGGQLDDDLRWRSEVPVGRRA
jgi:nucleoside-diphosphate-sugar epimerase